MIDLTNLYLFIITSFFLCLAPGPDNIFVLNLGMTRGIKAAIITTLGLCTGLIFHTSAAVFGISLILISWENLFNLIKYLGAIYLLYIAFNIFIHRNSSLNFDNKNSTKELKKLYIKGFFMNILNPKVSIFFLAFFPQFVNESLGNIQIQMMILGLVFIVMTIFVFSSIGISANIFSKKIVENINALKYLNIVTSFILFIMSIKLAFL